MAKKNVKGIGSAATQFKRQDILTYDARFYQYADMAAQIPDAVAEYRRLRNVAMNRLRKLQKGGYGETETVRAALEIFAALPKNLSHLEAAALLPDAARFITSRRGTVGGMREVERKTAETFRDRGFDFVNVGNVKRFTEFLDELGAEMLDELFYKEVEAAPKEGGRSRKQLNVAALQKAFEGWVEIADS